MISMAKKVSEMVHKLKDFQISLIYLEWEVEDKKVETNKRKSSLLPRL